MSMITPKRILVTFIAAILLVGAGMAGWVVYVVFLQQPNAPETQVAKHEPRCLEEYEKAVYSGYSNRRQGIPKPDEITVSVIDTRTNATTTSFTAPIISATHYHPVELRDCGVYFGQTENYDYENRTSLPGYAAYIRAFDYSGTLQNEIKISQDLVGDRKGYERFYGTDFRIPPDEKNIILTTGYVGDSDYAIIIKSLETKEDLFTLPLQELFTEVGFGGSLEFLNWTNNDRYFWTSLFEGAYTQGWIRIDTTDWSYEVYKAPGSGTDTMNGYPLNTTTGWIPYIPGSFWSGIVEIDEQINEDRKQQGETATLHLYNIFTKEDRVIYESNAPTWQDTGFFWKDDTTLEYTNPETGERVEYVVD